MAHGKTLRHAHLRKPRTGRRTPVNDKEGQVTILPDGTRYIMHNGGLRRIRNALKAVDYMNPNAEVVR